MTPSRTDHKRGSPLQPSRFSPLKMDFASGDVAASGPSARTGAAANMRKKPAKLTSRIIEDSSESLRWEGDVRRGENRHLTRSQGTDRAFANSRILVQRRPDAIPPLPNSPEISARR